MLPLRSSVEISSARNLTVCQQRFPHFQRCLRHCQLLRGAAGLRRMALRLLLLLLLLLMGLPLWTAAPGAKHLIKRVHHLALQGILCTVSMQNMQRGPHCSSVASLAPAH